MAETKTTKFDFKMITWPVRIVLLIALIIWAFATWLPANEYHDINAFFNQCVTDLSVGELTVILITINIIFGD